MQYIDSPHGGEGRSESEVAGPAPSDILEDSSQFGAQGVVEGPQVGSSLIQSALDVVPAVISLIEDDEDEEVSEGGNLHSDSNGDSPAVFGGGCEQFHPQGQY